MTKSTENKKLLNLQPYPGTRDFFPDFQRQRKWIFNKIHHILQKYGYEEYDGPFLETIDLYASKSSEEIVSQQLYSFEDRGNRIVAIRPEMTPTLARMVASKHKEMLKPIRWYSIPTCMRYERQQRGRLREFSQLNVDLFGANTFDEDIEIIILIVDIFKEFGANTNDFTIHINHRGLINNYLINYLGLDENLCKIVINLMDKIDKLTEEELLKEAIKNNLDLDKLEKIKQLMNFTLLDLVNLFGDNNIYVKEISEKFAILQKLGFEKCIKFSPSIMRGFDYYTGMVFEVYDNDKQNRRALFGGGRYDNLLEIFGSEPLSGIGFGTSDVSLLSFLEVHKLLPQLPKELDIAVLRFSDNDRLEAFELAQNLRNLGLKVQNPLSSQKFAKQITVAQKHGAKIIVFRGEEELKCNSFSAKWLESGIQKKYLLTDITLFVEEINNVNGK